MEWVRVAPNQASPNVKGQHMPRDAAVQRRIATTASHARLQGLSFEQRKALTEAATAGQLAWYERTVDPDGVLPPEEREAKAREAFSARMRAIAYLSVESRRRNIAARRAGNAA
jgi:hypothetical protein